MHFPASINEGLLLLLLFVVLIMPLVDFAASVIITRIYMSDIERPRNRILRLLTTTSILITVVSVFFAAISLGYIIRYFKGETFTPDFSSIAFVLAILALESTPVAKVRALWALDGSVQEVADVPEKD